MNDIDETRFYDTDVPYAKCIGTNYNIGLTHGKIAKEQIDRMVRIYERLFLDTAKIDWKEANSRAEKYLKYLEDAWPEIVEEMKGVADGCGRDILDIVTLNVRSEICLTNYSDGCTSLCHLNKENGNLFIGQNGIGSRNLALR